MSQDTIFDKILAKQVKADVVYEDENVLAFRDIMPQAPVHILVIPKCRAEDFDALSRSAPEQMGLLFHGVAKTAHKLGLHANGYRLVINNGRDAQQSVAYLHVHILAGRPLKWPPG